jgi:hypothetical protein
MLLPAEFEALELKEEFARRLGEQQRTIDILKVGQCTDSTTAWTELACHDAAVTLAISASAATSQANLQSKLGPPSHADLLLSSLLTLLLSDRAVLSRAGRCWLTVLHWYLLHRHITHRYTSICII